MSAWMKAGDCVFDNAAPSGDKLVAECFGFQRSANAHLIASAPYLLDVLKHIASYEGERDEDGPIMPVQPFTWETVGRAALDMAIAAIAKAEGR